MEHVWNEGFKVRCENDTDFALKVRHLAALAYLAVADVEEVFETLHINNDTFYDC